jgi:hypothetical protein
VSVLDFNFLAGLVIGAVLLAAAVLGVIRHEYNKFFSERRV